MIRPLLLCFLLAATPALAQQATQLPAVPDKACVSERPAQPVCPVLVPVDEVSVTAEAFGATRLREWRRGLGPDRTLRVYLGRADAAGRLRLASRPVPVRRACLDNLAAPGTEVRYIRAGTSPAGEDADGGLPSSWLVALNIPAPDGGHAVIALNLAQLRMYLWPEAGTEAGKGKIRSRRERMHAGMN